MSYELKLEQFSGPLDLLLQLIEREQMSINDIALAKVAEDYLAYAHTLGEQGVGDLADFLVIAARLLVIKSHSLLPELPVELEDGLSLADQLKMYKEFVVASRYLQDIIKQKNSAHFRPFIMENVDGKFFPPQGVIGEDMCEMFVAVLERLKPIVELPKIGVARAVSIAERIRHLREMLNKVSRVSFKKFLQSAEDRVDMIVSFLALLELIKQRNVIVNQTEFFEDIIIEQYEHTGTV